MNTQPNKFDSAVRRRDTVALILGVLWILSTGRTAPAATSTTRPAPDPAAAAPWLDRAQKDIASLPVETPVDFLMFQPKDLAIQLYLTAPTDDRRAFAARLIDLTVKNEVDKKKSAEQIAGAFIGGASDYWMVGDLASAGRMLDEADKPAGAAPTTDPVVRLGSSFNEMIHAEISLSMGDEKPFEQIKFTSLGYTLAISDFLSSGHLDQARRVVDFEARRVAAEATEPPGDFDSLGTDRVDVIHNLARCGEFAEAWKAAAIVDANLREKSLAADERFDAYLEITRASLEAGDMENYRLARTAVIDNAKQDPDGSPSDMLDLVRLCVAAKDSDGLKDGVVLLKSRFKGKAEGNGDPVNDVYALAILAGIYTGAGDVADYQAAVAEAENDLTTTFDTDSMTDERKADRAQNVAENYLRIAAQRARAGDIAGVQRDIDASAKAATLEAYRSNEDWTEIADGYADAGLFDRALAAAQAVKNDTLGGLPSYIARKEAKAGRFDDAWALAEQIPLRERAEIEYTLAVYQAEAGQEKKMPARVDSLKTPHEKALVELAIGQALLGREYQSNFRGWRPKDE